jgi:serine acetyltransferase
MLSKHQLRLLIRDLEFYCEFYPDHNTQLFKGYWYASKIVAGIIHSRDFRLNILVRIALSHIFIVSRVADSLIFYLYGSSISSTARLECRLRFCHARSVVIGPRVVMTGEFAYIYNNVTIGKLIPGSAKTPGDMPRFIKSVVFGVGSSVFGSLLCTHNVVFSSNSFCSLRSIDEDSTIWGHNNTKSGVFFTRSEISTHPIGFKPPKWAQTR